MKKLITIIFLLVSSIGYSQDFESVLPEIAWHTEITNVTYEGTDTFNVDVFPLDLSEHGAFPLEYGGFLMDIRGFRYEIIAESSGTITVVDVFPTEQGYAPFQGNLGAVYNSAGDWDLNTIPTIIYDRLGFKALSYGYRIDMKTLSNYTDANRDSIIILDSISNEKMNLLFDYSDVDSMLNNQAYQIEGQIYQVGSYFYKYNGTPTGTIDDYTRIGTTVEGGTGLANLYFTNDANTVVPTYNQMSYEFDETEVQNDVVIKSGTSPLYFQTFMFEDELGSTVIPAGTWSVTLYAQISSSSGTSIFGGDVFVRDTLGVETVLFSLETDDINSTSDFERVILQSIQPEFTVPSTSIFGVKAYASTTRVPSTTLSVLIGGSNGAFMNTTLALRHSQLRDKNGESEFQHVTLSQKNQIGINEDDIVNKLDLDGGNANQDVDIGSYGIGAEYGNFNDTDIGSYDDFLTGTASVIFGRTNGNGVAMPFNQIGHAFVQPRQTAIRGFYVINSDGSVNSIFNSDGLIVSELLETERLQFTQSLPFDTSPSVTNGAYLSSENIPVGIGYGASLEFGKFAGVSAKKAAISAYQYTADADRLGISFFTSWANAGATPVTEIMRLTDHIDIYSDLVGTGQFSHASAAGDDNLSALLIDVKQVVSDTATVIRSEIPTNNNQLVNGAGYETTTEIDNRFTNVAYTNANNIFGVQQQVVTNNNDFSLELLNTNTSGSGLGIVHYGTLAAIRVRDGSSNKLMQLDGSGELFFPEIDNASGTHNVEWNSSTGEITYAAKASSSLWTEDTYGITYADNVGIGGASNQYYDLYVYGDARFNSTLYAAGGIRDGGGGLGTSGQILSSTGTGIDWIDASSGSTPAGSDTQIQYNNSGAFGASSSFIYDGFNLQVTSGSVQGNTLKTSSSTPEISMVDSDSDDYSIASGNGYWDLTNETDSETLLQFDDDHNATIARSLVANGGYGSNINIRSANITLSTINSTVWFTSGTSSGVTLTLPSGSDYSKRVYTIINASSNTISSSNYYTYTTNTVQTTIPANSSIDLQYDGSSWYRIR